MHRLLSFVLFVLFSLQSQGQFQGLVVNEFSQGPTGGSGEYIELLVVGTRTCTDSTADLRGWIVDDQNGWYGTINASPGHYRFKDVSNWSAVPFGAILLLYNGADKNPSITMADDPTDANKDLTYILPISNTSLYFEQNVSQPSTPFNPSYTYPAASVTTGYGATTNQWQFIMALNNVNGDVISLVDPSNRAGAVFSIGYGYSIGPGFQNPTVSIPNVGSNSSAYLNSHNYSAQASWAIASVPSNETPGLPNGGANTVWITTMRLGRPGITAASLTPLVCFSSASQTTTLTYSSTRNSPTHYSIAWDAVPANSFAAVTNASLPVNSVPVFIPAGTLPGTYTGHLSVQNANGASCSTHPFTLTVMPPPATPVLNVQQPTCTTPGSMEVTSPVGAGLVYSIDGINYQSIPIFSNLASGNYTIWVKNGDGCISTLPFAIDPVPAAPPVPVVSVVQPTCVTPTGAISITAPLGAGLSYSIDGTNFQTANSFAGLVPGNYTVTVKNSSNCTVSANVMINTAPSVPTAPLVAVVNYCNGTSTLTASGFTGNLLWSNGATNNPVIVTTGGIYSVTQTINGCVSPAASIVAAPGVSPPVPLLTVVQPSCASSTGSITINSPLAPGYAYSIDGSTFTSATHYAGLVQNSYTITARNQQGCTSATIVAIQPPPAIPAAPLVTIVQPDCITAAGSIQVVSPQNGYGYSIDGTDYTNTSGIFLNLPPGVYAVIAKNSDGCISPVTQAIVLPPPARPLVQVNSPAVCPGDAATLTASVSPLANYTFVWTVPAGVPDPGNVAGFTSNVAGTYTVTVTAANGCTATASGTLTVNPLATVTANNQQVCAGGTVTLTGQPAGGVWSGTGVSGNQFDAATLVPGNYTVTYTYTSGTCSGAANAVITVNAVPSAPTVTVTNQCNQTSVLIATNFLGSLLWNTGENAASITVSAAGSYSVTQTVNGCTSIAAVATANPLSAPAAPIVASLQQPDCVMRGGSVTVTSPGTDISYKIDALGMVSATGQFSNLPPGAYPIYARSKEGCVSPGSFINILPAPPVPAAPAVQVTQQDCSGNLGSIRILSPLGGGLQYTVDGSTYQSSPMFNNLSAGNYLVQVRNTEGCVSATVAVQIQQPSGTVFNNLTACLSEGGSYNLNGQILATTGNYSTTYVRPGNCDSIVHLYLLVVKIERKEVSGCGSVTHNGVTYTSSTTLRDTLASTVTNCDSLYRVTEVIVYPLPLSSVTVCLSAGQTYAFNGQVLTTGGHYTGTFVSARGCDSMVHLYLTIAAPQSQTLSGCGVVRLNGVAYSKDTTITAIIPSVVTGCDSLIQETKIVVLPVPTLVVTPAKTICPGTSIQLRAVAANSTVMWQGFGTGNEITVSPLSNTTYTAIATSPSGCADTAKVTIGVDDFDLQLNLAPNPVIAGQTATLTTSASSSYEVLRWQPAFANPFGSRQVLVADTSLLVKVWARSAAGCVDSALLHLVVDPLGDVYIPGAFTPNGDGKNDLFLIGGGNFKTFVLKIFNRWGGMVFYSTERSKGWDGRSSGKELPTGTYVYLLSGTLKDGRVVERKGTVTLIR